MVPPIINSRRRTLSASSSLTGSRLIRIIDPPVDEWIIPRLRQNKAPLPQDTRGRYSCSHRSHGTVRLTARALPSCLPIARVDRRALPRRRSDKSFSSRHSHLSELHRKDSPCDEFLRPTRRRSPSKLLR